MTNYEMLLAAMEFEEVEFSYDIYFLIQEGYLKADAEYSSEGTNWNLVDKAVVNEYMRQNLLGFDVINLYAVRINASDHMIIMARKGEDARGYALNKLGQGNYKINRMPKEKWLKDFYFPETKEYKSLMDIRKEQTVFPTHIII